MNRKTFWIPLMLGLLLTGAAHGLNPAVESTEIPSLRGTTPDGRLAVDADGDLVVDAELRRFFDYFLSARGEVTDDRLRSAVAEIATERLPADAATSTSELFDLYLRYVDQARARLEMDPDRVAEAYRGLVATRAEILGSEVSAAFFGPQLRTELATLALQKSLVEADDPSHRKAARNAWEESLSAEEKAARAAARKPLDVSRQVAELRARGAGAEEIRAARAAAFGDEAAERLAELDRERAEWNLRVEQFRAQRAALLADPSLDAEQAELAIRSLLEKTFTGPEQRRLRALDRL